MKKLIYKIRPGLHLPKRPLIILSLVVLLISGCGDKKPVTYQGYVEGEFVFVAASSAGRLEKKLVRRGMRVNANDTLFILDQVNEEAVKRESLAKLKNARERLANISLGKRGPEIEVLRASAAQAEETLKLSELNLQRQEVLFSKGFIAKAQLDEARTAKARDKERLNEAGSQLRTALQSLGRDRELAAGEAEVLAYKEALLQSDWKLSQRKVISPDKALVFDTFYSKGEWVNAGSPLASLLPAQNIKFRFFVPEEMVGSLKIGQAVSAACNGCGAAIGAKINYISRQPEYTPPFIYSRDQRAKLVFLVEASPDLADAERLHPGQPVDVGLK